MLGLAPAIFSSIEWTFLPRNKSRAVTATAQQGGSEGFWQGWCQHLLDPGSVLVLLGNSFSKCLSHIGLSHPTGELAQRLFSLLHFCRAQAAVWGAQCNFSLSQHINCILTTCHTRGIKTYYCSHSTTLKETNRRLSAWIALLMSLEGREERHPYHGLLEQQS